VLHASPPLHRSTWLNTGRSKGQTLRFAMATINSLTRLRRSEIRASARARKTQFVEAIQSDLPSPVLLRKIFRFPRRANHLYQLAPSRSSRGAARDVTNAGRDAVDADGA
jgi:hypothetical protein